jgi:hypothetical protein
MSLTQICEIKMNYLESRSAARMLLSLSVAAKAGIANPAQVNKVSSVKLRLDLKKVIMFIAHK